MKSDSITIGPEVLAKWHADLSEKDAEIERLNGVVNRLTLGQVNYKADVAIRDEQIERLKEENEKYAEIVAGLRQRARKATNE
jgi:hypothetical protein